MPRPPDYLIGAVIGAWTVLGEPYLAGKNKVLDVRCACGRTSTVRVSKLRAGLSSSCKPCSKIKHGDSSARLYHVWAGMKRRCYNPNVAMYPRYGGRGITICPEWHDYGTFKAWAYAAGYRDDAPRGGEALSIERIDPDGNYEPSNCEWITSSENARRMNAHRKAA
jgi:hypothetical protein